MITARRRRARGFTLLEVLVALVILGIGVLGIAKLTLFSVRSNGSAYLRSQAASLAQAGLDYLRANRPSALNGAYQLALTASPPGAPNCLAAAACSPSDYALYDQNQWITKIAQALPSGQGAIATALVNDPVTGTTEVTATITVQWDDAVAQSTINKAAAGVAQPMQVVLETVL